MHIHSIYIQNYRPFSVLEETRLGKLATIIGQNDVGKSNILRAISLFMNLRPKLTEDDFHDQSGPDDDIIIEMSFNDLPDSIEIESGVPTTLQEEKIVDSNGLLRIRKVYSRAKIGQQNIFIFTSDFENDKYSGLYLYKEKDLNKTCEDLEIDHSKSGRGITNKSKREAIRERALEEGDPIVDKEIAVKPTEDLWKTILKLLPEFELFQADTKLGVSETTFQSQFKPIVNTAVEKEDVVEARDQFTGLIEASLQGEVDKIFKRLSNHTNAFTGLSAKPIFQWDKFVSFDILGKDGQGIEQSLERRGSGMRRLLMVAFFQYLAERENENKNFIFGIEEPENYLHPGLQRELIYSFRKLSDEGYQIVMTSHSPVFAGTSPLEDLTLITRKEGAAESIQIPELQPSEVAEELGVDPADQITGYDACIFVEGPDDIMFWKVVCTKLKEGGHLVADFEDKNIGFAICGGESIKHWVNLRAMARLNRKFEVFVDSDRKNAEHNIPQRKLNWKEKCENEGGLFFISRKREVENYLHLDALKRGGKPEKEYDDFSDMKDLFGEKVIKVVHDMSAAEILEMDKYFENGQEYHELKGVAEAFLGLSNR